MVRYGTSPISCPIRKHGTTNKATKLQPPNSAIVTAALCLSGMISVVHSVIGCLMPTKLGNSAENTEKISGSRQTINFSPAGACNTI